MAGNELTIGVGAMLETLEYFIFAFLIGICLFGAYAIALKSFHKTIQRHIASSEYSRQTGDE